MGDTIFVGLRKVVKNGASVAITLPKPLHFLKGKMVIVELKVWEPPRNVGGGDG